jgi:hypothetical protein
VAREIEYEDVRTIMVSLMRVHVKLDRIVAILEDENGEEEEDSLDG